MLNHSSPSRKSLRPGAGAGWLLLGAIVCLSLASCVKRPELLRLVDARIIGVADSSMTVELDYLVHNPNRFKAKVSNTELEAYFQNVNLGRAYTQKEIILPSRDTGLFRTRMDFPLDELERFYPVFLKQDSTEFRIKGQNSVKFVGRQFNVNIDEKIVLNTRQFILQQIKGILRDSDNLLLESIRMSKLPSISSLSLESKIKLVNDFELDYEVKEVKLDFLPKGSSEPIAHWELDDAFSMQAQSQKSLPIRVEIDNLNVLKNFKMKWLSSGELDLQVKGNARVVVENHSFSLPINQMKTVKVSAMSIFGN